MLKKSPASPAKYPSIIFVEEQGSSYFIVFAQPHAKSDGA